MCAADRSDRLSAGSGAKLLIVICGGRGGRRSVALVVMVLGVLSLVACGSSASTVTATVADCTTPVPVRPQAVFAVGISWRGRVCWETAVTGPPAANLFHSSSAPLFDGGTVLLSSDGQLVAVSLRDGHHVWSSGSGGGGVDSDGVGSGDYVIDAEGGVVVAGEGGSYVGLATRNGRALWSEPEA